MVSDVRFGGITADVCCILCVFVCVCTNPFREELASSALVITDSDAESDKGKYSKAPFSCFVFAS